MRKCWPQMTKMMWKLPLSRKTPRMCSQPLKMTWKLLMLTNPLPMLLLRTMLRMLLLKKLNCFRIRPWLPPWLCSSGLQKVYVSFPPS